MSLIPGAPNLLKKQAKSTAIVLISQGLNILYDFFFPAARWGIYEHGTDKVVQEFSSVLEVDVTGDSNVSDYMIETGSFVNFNKVETPNFYRVRMTQDGSIEKRAKTLEWLEAKKGGVDLFDVVTPEYVWKKVNLISFRNTRNARSGAAMLSVDCVFQQIREKPAKYSNSKTSKPEYEETSPTVKTYPVENRTVQATTLPPL